MAGVATIPSEDVPFAGGTACMSILGWFLVVAAAISAFVFFRRSSEPAREGVTPPPNRAIALGSAIVAVGLAVWLINAAPPSVADLKPKLTEDFSTEPKRWVFNVPSQVGWDPKGQQLRAKMKVGEGWWGVVPVDWDGD